MKFLKIFLIMFMGLSTLTGCQTAIEEAERKKEEKALIKQEEKRKRDEERETERIQKEEEELAELEANTIVITAEEVINEYYANRVRADDMYKGKRLELDGEVSGIDKMLWKTYITFYNGEYFDFMHITCYLKDEEDIETLINVEKGDRVTVVGTLKKKNINSLDINDCKFK